MQRPIDAHCHVAIAEKITAMETEEYLSLRAARGEKARFISVLDKVKDTVPDEFDSQ